MVPIRAVVCALFVASSVLAEGPSLEDYRDRRSAVAEAIGDDSVAVLFAAGEGRRAANLYYLTGLEIPSAALVLRPGGGASSEVLYLPPRDRKRERWDGPALGPGGYDDDTGSPDAERLATIERTGIAAVRSLDKLEQDLWRSLRRDRQLWVALDPNPPSEPLDRAHRFVRGLRERLPSLEVRDVRPALTELRLIKSDAELALIRRAAELTLEAHREVTRLLTPDRPEYEAKALIEYVFRRAGAVGPSFPSIVGSGSNGLVLHYQGESGVLDAGELVVIDIGAEWRGYAADVTRTYPVSGRFSERQREIYDIVLAAQAAGIAAVKPGARLRRDVHAAARQVIDEAGYGDAFPHGTSHYVGLEVHDVGPRDGKLRAGMVITVEPGIYLEDEGVGVRIEDMVLVTDDGCEVLTASLPRTADAIEGLLAGATLPMRTSLVERRLNESEQDINEPGEQHPLEESGP